MHCEAPASTSAFMTICFRKARKTWFGSAMRDFTGGWCSRAMIGFATTSLRKSGPRSQTPIFQHNLVLAHGG
jgi:hypothetical protein